MNKQDLTQYSDNELSMHVFNDEYLYNNRHRSFFKSIIDETFVYTAEQWDVLSDDLQDDLEEEKA